MIALAPASIVAFIESSVGPPVAMIGILGYFSLIFFTISGVFLAAETLKISAPFFILPSISSSSLTTEIITGMSTDSEI